MNDRFSVARGYLEVLEQRRAKKLVLSKAHSVPRCCTTSSLFTSLVLATKLSVRLLKLSS
jgi:hypothetical protein